MRSNLPGNFWETRRRQIVPHENRAVGPSEQRPPPAQSAAMSAYVEATHHRSCARCERHGPVGLGRRGTSDLYLNYLVSFD